MKHFPVSRIKKMHNGLFHCPLYAAWFLMPDLRPIFDSAPINKKEDYIVDVKVHMLMPGQWPCIPNWHRDNIPRDKNNKQIFSEMDQNKKMLLWVSGEPLTEFKGTGKVPAQEWVSFTQYDWHRGTMSKEHTWRLFIRLTPKPLLKPAHKNQWHRRHSQVYLDAKSFKW